MNQHQLVLCDRLGLDPRNAKRRFCDQLLFRFGFEQCGWLFGFESVGGLSIAIPVCTDCESLTTHMPGATRRLRHS
jgi:hypothetical protein